MYIKKRQITLNEVTYAYIGRATDEENAEEFKNKLREYISILKEFIETDFNKLNDKELYELLSKIYDISLDERDYLKMLSKYNNKEYVFIDRIPTTMTYFGRATEGYGRSFDWWEQLYQVYYVVATSDTFKFDYNKVYSKEEIKKLSSNKSIVLLKKEEEAINGIKDFIQEEYEPIPTLDVDIKYYSHNISQFILNNYSLFGELLRKRFTKRNVLKDLKKIVDYLNEEIQYVFSATQSKDPYYSGTATKCKEWFESSDEKKEYLGIQKKYTGKAKN